MSVKPFNEYDFKAKITKLIKNLTPSERMDASKVAHYVTEVAQAYDAELRGNEKERHTSIEQFRLF